jgi:GNAT superfamily N-acetyltransferase
LKPLSWVRFTWGLTNLPEAPSDLPAHYRIDRATADDSSGLRKVFSSAFMLDPVWSPAIGQVMKNVQSWLDRAFDDENKVCLALRHGTRIIGAALLHTDAQVESHLAPGPSVLMEYRNRGFGSFLLERSLQTLRQAGLTTGSGIARDSSPAAKFLYPKFGGVSVPLDIGSLAAA